MEKEKWVLQIELREYVCTQVNQFKPNQLDIATLKYQWCRKYNLEELINSCFLCEASAGDCEQCPGTLIDAGFSCSNHTYSYNTQPHRFLAKLKELYQEEFGDER